jgi:hypothetical protein
VWERGAIAPKLELEQLLVSMRLRAIADDLPLFSLSMTLITIAPPSDLRHLYIANMKAPIHGETASRRCCRKHLPINRQAVVGNGETC